MNSEPAIRILIVDDSFLIRKIIVEMLKGRKDFVIVGEAKDGQEAYDLALQLKPDVITMDYNMPVMNGEEAVKLIARDMDPMPAVIMVSSFTTRGAEETFRCLKYGAVDFVPKPDDRGSLDLVKVRNELIEKIHLATLAQTARSSGSPTLSFKKGIDDKFFAQVVVIGASTGGPPQVEDILLRLPSNLKAAVLVVQHMPEVFTGSLAERIDRMSPLKVSEAKEGDLIEPGRCYIARGNWHMIVTRKIVEGRNRCAIHLNQEQKLNGYRPSIDHTMKSAVKIYHKHVLGIELTGMGYDGSQGMATIKNSGGHTIVQSPESAMIRSMPDAVIKLDAADEILPVSEIPSRIVSLTV